VVVEYAVNVEKHEPLAHLISSSSGGWVGMGSGCFMVYALPSDSRDCRRTTVTRVRAAW
jgi:hypothetical protein